MKTITKYVAEDGTEFDSEALCSNYEDKCTLYEHANKRIQEGASLYEVAEILDEWGYFSSRGIAEDNPDLFKAITKDTKFVVRHWQCRDEAGYQPCEVKNERVMLYGDAGCWRGPYGNWVSFKDIVRYASQTPSLKHLVAVDYD